MNTQIVPQPKTGVKPPMPLIAADKNEFAQRAQKARLSAAVAAAKQGNLSPLRNLVGEEQEKRDKISRQTWQDYRIQRVPGSEKIIGVVTPVKIWQGEQVAFRYRVEEIPAQDGGNKAFLRFLGCPDQDYCDQVNAVVAEYQQSLPTAEKSVLSERLETKHALILALKEEAFAAGGTWYRAAEHPFPIIDAFSGELVSAGGEQPEPLPALTFCFGPLVKGAVLGTLEQVDLELQVCKSSPCFVKSKEPAVTTYTLMGNGQARETFELVTGMSIEETKAVMLRLRDALCQSPERLSLLKARAEEAK